MALSGIECQRVPGLYRIWHSRQGSARRRCKSRALRFRRVTRGCIRLTSMRPLTIGVVLGALLVPGAARAAPVRCLLATVEADPVSLAFDAAGDGLASWRGLSGTADTSRPFHALAARTPAGEWQPPPRHVAVGLDPRRSAQWRRRRGAGHGARAAGRKGPDAVARDARAWLGGAVEPRPDAGPRPRPRAARRLRRPAADAVRTGRCDLVRRHRRRRLGAGRQRHLGARRREARARGPVRPRAGPAPRARRPRPSRLATRIPDPRPASHYGRPLGPDRARGEGRPLLRAGADLDRGRRRAFRGRAHRDHALDERRPLGLDAAHARPRLACDHARAPDLRPDRQHVLRHRQPADARDDDVGREVPCRVAGAVRLEGGARRHRPRPGRRLGGDMVRRLDEADRRGHEHDNHAFDASAARPARASPTTR